MVARSNFSLQDISYSRLLQVPDDEREFLTLDELKPHHLTELGAQYAQEQQEQHQHVIQQQQQQLANDVQLINQNIQQGYNVYYDLNTQTTNGQCGNLYIGGPTSTTSNDLSNSNLMDSGIHSMETSISNHSSAAVTNNHNHHLHIEPHHRSPQSTYAPSMTGSTSRKRKASYSEYSDLDDDDAKSIRTTDENKKQNHSEIEKRRRDKMNTYITELSAMVPMCHAMSRKLDKLTVLRMAVQHLKTIRGAVHSYTEGLYKPAFLSDQELKMLILQAADGFLFVVDCDRGRILYVSESVSQILNYSQGDLLGQSWFDILHPKDVAKIKEQLSSSDLSPRERLIDAKTMLPVKTDVPQSVTRLCPGARRSFFCRMKYKNNVQVKEENDIGQQTGCRRKKQMGGNDQSCTLNDNLPLIAENVISDKKYCVIQCTGYLKSWAPAKVGLEEQDTTDGESESCNLSCLVAVGRLQPNIFQNGFNTNLSSNKNCSNSNNQNTGNSNKQNLRNIQFVSRHAMDGKFLFVDQRATLVLGFLPQELLGTSMYEYYHHEDIPALADAHKNALRSNEKVTTSVYRLRTKDHGFINVQTEWKSFKNPWTKDYEYLIAKNNVILSDLRNFDGNHQMSRTDSVENNYDFFNQSNGREMQRMINTHIEASKIGRQISDEVLEFQRRLGDFSSGSSPDLDPTLAQAVPLLTENPLLSSVESTVDRRSSESASTSQASTTVPRLNGTLPSYNHVRNNVIVGPENGNSEIIQMINASSDPPVSTVDGSNGNDEAAMAVIMSLLEADAGLGGPVDFSGLPWPLP